MKCNNCNKENFLAPGAPEGHCVHCNAYVNAFGQQLKEDWSEQDEN